MIKGEKVSLRAVSKDDLPLFMEWRNRPHYRQYFREYKELNIQNQEQWFEKFVVCNDNTLMFTITENDENQTPVGCLGLCYINWIQRNADLSLYIGKNDVYIDDQGWAMEACRLLFSYGFGELCLHKIWTEIYEFDKQKDALYKTLGFKQDGLLRDNYFHNNRFWNSRILSLLAQEFYTP